MQEESKFFKKTEGLLLQLNNMSLESTTTRVSLRHDGVVVGRRAFHQLSEGAPSRGLGVDPVVVRAEHVGQLMAERVSRRRLGDETEGQSALGPGLVVDAEQMNQ